VTVGRTRETGGAKDAGGDLAAGVCAGDRAAVARAITLLESARPDHRIQARELLAELPPPDATATIRVGISGIPGAGKSTFVEALGSMLTEAGHTVGVLAVDPSSVRTGGSVLGDKTRMTRLANDLRAFVRPSPNAGTLGGVARATSESMLVLEAAGYDVVLIETVGVGQADVAVAGIVDTFVVLTLSRTGDQLQGIKRGILEQADVVGVNKADGEHRAEAEVTCRELAAALRMVAPTEVDRWATPVLACSGQTGAGVAAVWRAVLDHRAHLGPEGLRRQRAGQQWDNMWALVRDGLDQRLAESASVQALRAELRDGVLSGEVPAVVAADRVLAAFDGDG
jgi:LAO/AO transport system kinase